MMPMADSGVAHPPARVDTGSKQRRQTDERQHKVVAKKDAGENSEKELDAGQYFELRSRRINSLRETKAPHPYPHKFLADYEIRNLSKDFGRIKVGETVRNKVLRVAGRMYNKRADGNKLVFYDIGNEGIKIQIVCQAQDVAEDGIPFADQHEHLRRGDIIGVVGYPGHTTPDAKGKEDSRNLQGKWGLLSIFATCVTLLAPCLHNVPQVLWWRTHDHYRKRYLDLIVNMERRKVLIMRSKILRYIRRYFDEHDFVEVETPVMTSTAGDAAKPFVTRHDELSMPIYLRAAPEKHLKMLVVGGLNRVYEIGRQFHNDAACIDLKLGPEYTTCEFYQAYTDVDDIMRMTEELVSGLVQHMTCSYNTNWTAPSAQEYNMRWNPPWKRIDIIPALEVATDEKFPPGDQLHTEEAGEFLQRVLKKNNLSCPLPLTNARMMEKLVNELIRPSAFHPTLITGYPQVMWPAAKPHCDKPGLSERFETFVCRKQLAKGCTEANDPFYLQLHSDDQSQADEPATAIDEDYCSALDHGRPPTGGCALDIERLVMLLTDNNDMQDVLAFPFVKDESPTEKGKFPVEQSIAFAPAESIGNGR